MHLENILNFDKLLPVSNLASSRSAVNVEQVKNIRLQPQECSVSYDVKALFTSVPIKPAIKIIKQLLEDDKELPQRTSMTVHNIICLLEFCLNNTCFIFQGRFHEQTEGAAMGSPLSPIIANL